jgi:pyruvate dehydrogenase complex dehydrogenase (E1) component
VNKFLRMTMIAATFCIFVFIFVSHQNNKLKNTTIQNFFELMGIKASKISSVFDSSVDSSIYFTAKYTTAENANLISENKNTEYDLPYSRQKLNKTLNVNIPESAIFSIKETALGPGSICVEQMCNISIFIDHKSETVFAWISKN